MRRRNCDKEEVESRTRVWKVKLMEQEQNKDEPWEGAHAETTFQIIMNAMTEALKACILTDRVLPTVEVGVFRADNKNDSGVSIMLQVGGL